MLKIEGLSFTYGRREVLSELSLSLEKGEIGILLGKNGVGKSTLFKNILGLCKKQSGKILLDGKRLEEISPRERARLISWVPQDIRFGGLTVFDTVLSGRGAYFGFRAGKEDLAAAERAICELGLEDLAFRLTEELSGGERQRVAVARALAGEPKLMLFDEPTGNLDVGSEARVLREVKAIARERGITVFASLHDLNAALSLGDRFLTLKNGVITHSVTQGELTAELLSETFDTEIKILSAEGRSFIVGDVFYED